MVVQVVTLIVSSGTLAAVLKLAFDAGKLVARLDAVERRVWEIEEYGCRHECAEGAD